MPPAYRKRLQRKIMRMTDRKFYLSTVAQLASIAILVIGCCHVLWLTYVEVPQLQRQRIQDSLQIVSLKSSLQHTNTRLDTVAGRVDTVYLIINDEIKPDLSFNSGQIDSLGEYTQKLNIRTAPLLHYRE